MSVCIISLSRCWYLLLFSLGVILRDSHGVAQVRFVTGNKILRILKSKGLAPDLPEDLYHLIKKAVAVRKHLERNRKVTKLKHARSFQRILEKSVQCTSSVSSPLLLVFAGQGCQVPPDSGWEQNPQACPLLQDQESTCTQLEVVSVRVVFITKIEIPPVCVGHISLSHSSLVRTEIFLMC